MLLGHCSKKPTTTALDEAVVHATNVKGSREVVIGKATTGSLKSSTVSGGTLNMQVQVTITRTTDGANTKVESPDGEASKDYASWSEALKEAESIGLLNSVEAIAAKALPPGIPLHTNADVAVANLSARDFTMGKTSPPR
jgi:hypothetical protein